MACEDGICFVYSFLWHLVAYFLILALLVTITVLVMKCIGDWRERNENEEVRNENIPLMHERCYPEKAFGVTMNYGSCHQDIETGNCSNDNNNYATKLYNSNICVICYDEQRNCFFVPCGHRATCHICAQRIFHEETRNCPICRRVIGKIRRLVDS